MVKSFCNDCKHKNVREELKVLFNENVHKTFITCPCEETDKIEGCLTKSINIDWGSFETFCEENDLKWE